MTPKKNSGTKPGFRKSRNTFFATHQRPKRRRWQSRTIPKRRGKLSALLVRASAK
jgi:hypothetical protein